MDSLPRLQRLFTLTIRLGVSRVLLPPWLVLCRHLDEWHCSYAAGPSGGLFSTAGVCPAHATDGSCGLVMRVEQLDDGPCFGGGVLMATIPSRWEDYLQYLAKRLVRRKDSMSSTEILHPACVPEASFCSFCCVDCAWAAITQVTASRGQTTTLRRPNFMASLLATSYFRQEPSRLSPLFL